MGRRFAHPVMRIGFEAPTGFTLTNSPQAILIEGPDGLRGEFSGGRLPPGGLEAYPETVLASLLRGAQVELGQAEGRTVNGVNAMVVPAVVQTEQGEVRLTMAAYEGGDAQAYHFLMISSPGAAPPASLDDLFRSFRLLSAQEAARLRPRRIDVMQIGPQDTIQGLAARMSTDDPVGHFLMLNGRTADRPPGPGDMVKLVVASPR
jgi:predicted Zn-dependent protease